MSNVDSRIRGFVKNLEAQNDQLKNRIAELERYNLGLANESCDKSKRIAELERERDELIVFSQYLIECHRDEVKALVDTDFSKYVAKRDLEQQVKVLKGFAEYYECESVKRHVTRYIEQLHKGAE